MPAPGAVAVLTCRYAFDERRRGVGQAEQAGELRVGPHRDQVAAGADPVGEHRHLAGVERHLAEDDDVVVRQHGSA